MLLPQIPRCSLWQRRDSLKQITLLRYSRDKQRFINWAMLNHAVKTFDVFCSNTCAKSTPMYFNVRWNVWVFEYFSTFSNYSLSAELVQSVASHNRLIWKKKNHTTWSFWGILKEWCNTGSISRWKGGFGCCCYMRQAWPENVYLVPSRRASPATSSHIHAPSSSITSTTSDFPFPLLFEKTN